RNDLGEIVMPSQRLRQQSRRAVLRLRRTKSRYRVRVVEIPLVLGDADEITNGWIARPGLAERSACQFGGYAALQKPAYVGVGGDGLNRWQTIWIKELIGRRGMTSRLR